MIRPRGGHGDHRDDIEGAKNWGARQSLDVCLLIAACIGTSAQLRSVYVMTLAIQDEGACYAGQMRPKKERR